MFDFTNLLSLDTKKKKQTVSPSVPIPRLDKKGNETNQPNTEPNAPIPVAQLPQLKPSLGKPQVQPTNAPNTAMPTFPIVQLKTNPIFNPVIDNSPEPSFKREQPEQQKPINPLSGFDMNSLLSPQVKPDVSPLLVETIMNQEAAQPQIPQLDVTDALKPPKFKSPLDVARDNYQKAVTAEKPKANIWENMLWAGIQTLNRWANPQTAQPFTTVGQLRQQNNIQQAAQKVQGLQALEDQKQKDEDRIFQQEEKQFNRYYRGKTLENLERDDKRNEEQFQERQRNSALSKLVGQKYFDPKNPAHIAQAKAAGVNPEDLQGWDDRNPFTKTIGGRVYQYNRENGTFEPTNLPADESKFLTDYQVTLPNGETRIYKVAQSDAAKFAMQAQALGVQIQKANSEISGKNSEDETAYNDKLNTYNAQKSAYDTHIEGINNQMQFYTDSNNALRGELATLNKFTDKARIQQIQTKIGENDSKFAELKGKLGEIQAKQKALVAPTRPAPRQAISDPNSIQKPQKKDAEQYIRKQYPKATDAQISEILKQAGY